MPFSSQIKSIVNEAATKVYSLEVVGEDEVRVLVEGYEALVLRGGNSLSIALTFANLNKNFNHVRADDFMAGVLAGMAYNQSGGKHER